MTRRVVPATFLLLAVCGILTVALTGAPAETPVPAAPAAPVRILPGIQPSGEVLLPNGWSLRPAGRQLPLGDFPINIAIHPSGNWLAVLHAGFGTHEIILVDLRGAREHITCRVPLDQTWLGLTWSPDGSTLYASGAEFEVVHTFAFEDGYLVRKKPLRIAPEKEKFIPGGLAMSTDGKTLFAAGTWGNAVRIVPTSAIPEDKARTVDLGKDTYPYACLPTADGKRLYVSLWGKATIAVVDLSTDTPAGSWAVASHPTEMALSPDGKLLYVSCANSTRVEVLDTETGKSVETINCALYPASPSGNTPSSLCLTPDGKMLTVANADANNLAVFNVSERGKTQPLGFIPVGWYPTSVRFNPKTEKLYVANGKGLTSRANPQGPGPYARRELAPIYQYIGALMQGTLSVIDQPSAAKMAEYGKQAYRCSPLRDDLSPVGAEELKDNPIPRKVGETSPIRHVIYIIKENRTYDQVYGDMKGGNGDPSLCLFPEKVTPNHHKLAREFVLLDNTYVEGEVSADGHQWSMAAYASDFVEKVWPQTYRGNPLKKFPTYPSEGAVAQMERPEGGYIWDRCKEAGISYRSYGEWVENAKMKPDGSFDDGKALVEALKGHIDPKFRTFDMDYPDVKRADRFIEELKRFEKEGEMPRFTILRLPNDHTAGTKPGSWTPMACLADNDLALGKVVEAVSESKFWKDTAIFSIEDDAQNGPDHVDAHRTVSLVISPYTKRNYIDSTPYTTSSLLRTMELILGLKPMSQFDAAARPMYASFTSKPDFTPYKHVVPETDRDAKNTATAWGAKMSEKFDLTKEDAVDDLLLNEVIWRSVKGADSKMPAPVRAAFYFPKPKKDRDDDDKEATKAKRQDDD
jgi:DNA-binding beta-propeller fold protein YncE